MWKYIPIDLKLSTVGSWVDTVVSDLTNATEIKVLCGSVVDDGYVIEFDLIRVDGRQYCTTTPYNFISPSNSNYNFSFDVRWEPEQNKLGIRQTVKGSNAQLQGIIGVPYR